jgi:hypothetical protein
MSAWIDSNRETKRRRRVRKAARGYFDRRRGLCHFSRLCRTGCPPELHLHAFGQSPGFETAVSDRLTLQPRMLGRIVFPPFGALSTARQPEAEDVFDLLERQDELVPCLLREKVAQRRIFVSQALGDGATPP